MNNVPSAAERKVSFLGGATIDGAPVPYVVVFAAVVTALAFVPFTIALGGGTAFPLSQVIYPLSGIVLGPIAGAIANGIGTLIGVFVAPHTAGTFPVMTVLQNMVIGFVAGTVVIGPERKKWWIIPVLLTFANNMVSNIVAVVVAGAEPSVVAMANLAMWFAYLLWFIPPTRALFARWLSSANLGFVAAGIFFVTLMATIVGMNVGIDYYVYMWPNEVWGFLIPMIPTENLFRCIVGSVLGTGVIAGIRAIGLVKPKWALF